jgi:hypothetical protein
MKTALTSVIGGIVTYIVANTLIDTMVTGTGTGDTLITTIGPIVLAVMVVLVILKLAD